MLNLEASRLTNDSRKVPVSNGSTISQLFVLDHRSFTLYSCD